MKTNTVDIYIITKPIAPDSITDVEKLLTGAFLEAEQEIRPNLLAESDFTMEQRAPIPLGIVELVTSVKLIFKDFPDSIAGVKVFITKLKEKLLHSDVIEVTATFNGQKFFIKTENKTEWNIEIGEDLRISHKSKKKRK